MSSLLTLSTKRLRRLGFLLLGGGILFALYYFIDPANSILAPKCIFRTLSGLDCPGCGSQRMLHALLHADFAEAWHANPFIIIISPYLLFWIWIDTDPDLNPSIYRRLNSIPAVAVIILLAIIWTILRNIFPVTS